MPRKSPADPLAPPTPSAVSVRQTRSKSSAPPKKVAEDVSAPEKAKRGRKPRAATTEDIAQPVGEDDEGGAPAADGDFGGRAKIRRHIVLPAQDVGTGAFHVQESDAVSILQNRKVLKSTLEMLASRGDKYDVQGLLAGLDESQSARDFQLMILYPGYLNVVRDIIARHYTKRASPSIRVMMSLMLKHKTPPSEDGAPPPPATYTTVFFAERKAQQVSKRLVEVFFKTLEVLKSSAFNVTETIFVTPVPFSHDSEAQRKSLGAGCFSQVFRDEEVLAPATECELSPRVRIFTKEQTRDFFARNPSYKPEIMEQRSHTDPLLRYLGARQHHVAEFIRPPVAPFNLRRTELLYVWIH